MNIGDKILELVGKKSKEATERLAQKYRDHVGEELTTREKRLESLRVALEIRDKLISEREAKLKKYYLLPRAVFNIPLGITFIVAVYFAYASFNSDSRATANLAEYSTQGSTYQSNLTFGSDDYAKYHLVFEASARQLISDGRCSSADFKNMGGWVKSTTTYKNEPIYFTYCGEMTINNRIYLNAISGQVFQ